MDGILCLLGSSDRRSILLESTFVSLLSCRSLARYFRWDSIYLRLKACSICCSHPLQNLPDTGKRLKLLWSGKYSRFDKPKLHLWFELTVQELAPAAEYVFAAHI